MRFFCLLSCLAVLVPAAGAPHAQSHDQAFGPASCVSPVEWAIVRARLASYEMRRYGRRITAQAAGPQAYGFYPLAVNLTGDLAIINYVDVDPSSPGILDWAGFSRTYDGHNGHDTSWTIARSDFWQPMDVGWPIFAALDGTVADAHDGEFDRNVNPPAGTPANYVILDHGGGHYPFTGT